MRRREELNTARVSMYAACRIAALALLCIALSSPAALGTYNLPERFEVTFVFEA